MSSPMPKQQGAALAKVNADRRRQLVEGVLATGTSLWVRGAGWSMHPTIRPRERVLLEPLCGAPRAGDIIAISVEQSILVHRVIGLANGLFFTRGDGNGTVGIDRPATNSRILAIATAVERDGRIVALRPTLRHGPTALAFYAYYTARRTLAGLFNAKGQARETRNR